MTGNNWSEQGSHRVRSIKWEGLEVGDSVYVKRVKHRAQSLAWYNGKKLGRKFRVEMVTDTMARIIRMT